ncbi:MAG: ybjD [Frankiales bacterium]|nr:ybjD [Frankiales bacterium]
MSIIDHVLNVLGVMDGGGRWYLWWSGMFGNITIFAALVMLYRRHNCHIHRCWRIGRHTAVDANGVEHVVCKTHHPDLGKGHQLHPHHLVSGSAGSSPPAPR